MPTLKVQKNGIVYPVKLYDTEAMAGDVGNSTSTLKVKYNGAEYYARMTGCLSGACGGDTPLRYKSVSGTTYQITRYGEYRVSPTNCFYVLNNSNNTFSKRDNGWFGDGESAYYEYYWSDSGSNSNFNYIDVTIPKNCNMVRLEGYGGQTSNNAIFIQVTAGKTYRIVSWRGENIAQYTQSYTTTTGSGKTQRTEWNNRQANYVQNRYRQLVFTYTNFRNDGSVKTIIVTNASTSGGGFVTYEHKYMLNGKYHTEKLTTGANDAQWGNAGFMRVCFGKGNYNYEANAPQDTML